MRKELYKSFREVGKWKQYGIDVVASLSETFYFQLLNKSLLNFKFSFLLFLSNFQMLYRKRVKKKEMKIWYR